MKKAIVFIFGLVIGVVVCCLAGGKYSISIEPVTTEPTTQATAEEEVIRHNITYSSVRSYLDEEIESKINELTLEVQPIIHYGRINEDGNGVAVVGGGEGMQSFYVQFLKTADDGQTWEIVSERQNIYTGEKDFVFLEERFIMFNHGYCYCGTSIEFSDDYGKTWKVVRPSDFFADSSIELPEKCCEEYMSLKQLVLDVDDVEKTFVIAFLSEDGKEVVYIAKCNMDVEIIKEYYVNKQAILEAIIDSTEDS